MSTTISDAKLAANRANAQKSTGPRSPEGKARSCQNAVKHGLLASAVLISRTYPGEEVIDLDQLVQSLLDEFRPSGAWQRLLVDRLAACYWRLRRAYALEAQLFAGRQFGPLSLDKSTHDACPELGPHDTPPEVRLATLARYEGLIDRELHRTLHQLEAALSDRDPVGAVSDRDSVEPASDRDPATVVPDPTDTPFADDAGPLPAPDDAKPVADPDDASAPSAADRLAPPAPDDAASVPAPDPAPNPSTRHDAPTASAAQSAKKPNEPTAPANRSTWHGLPAHEPVDRASSPCPRNTTRSPRYRSSAVASSSRLGVFVRDALAERACPGFARASVVPEWMRPVRPAQPVLCMAAAMPLMLANSGGRSSC